MMVHHPTTSSGQYYIRYKRLYYGIFAQSSYHRVSWWMQAFDAMKLPYPGTQLKGHPVQNACGIKLVKLALLKLPQLLF